MSLVNLLAVPEETCQSLVGKEEVSQESKDLLDFRQGRFHALQDLELAQFGGPLLRKRA